MSDNLSSFLGSAESIPKRVMPIFFLVDTSGSMEGNKIGQVNSAIEELIPDLRQLSDSQADSEIKLAVLRFSTGCEWVTPSLISLESFDDWEPLEAGGLTDLGSAFEELNTKLSKNGFMDRSSASSGFYAPVIILLSDGEPTDDYNSALKKLKDNKWFQSAIKIAIAIGPDANRDILKKCIKNPELLFSVDDKGNLNKVIRFIALTSSQVASTSAAVTEETANQPADVSNVTSEASEKQIAEAVKSMMEEDNEGFAPINSEQENIEETPADPVTAVDDSDDEWD